MCKNAAPPKCMVLAHRLSHIILSILWPFAWSLDTYSPVLSRSCCWNMYSDNGTLFVAPQSWATAAKGQRCCVLSAAPRGPARLGKLVTGVLSWAVWGRAILKRGGKGGSMSRHLHFIPSFQTCLAPFLSSETHRPPSRSKLKTFLLTSGRLPDHPPQKKKNTHPPLDAAGIHQLTAQS